MNHKLTTQPQPIPTDHSDIHLLESHHSGDFHMSWTKYEFAKILLILEGSGNLYHPEGVTRLAKGTLIVVRSHTSHYIEDDRSHPLSLFVLCIFDEYLQQSLHNLCLQNAVALAEPSLASVAMPIMRRILYEQKTGLPGSALFRNGFTAQFIAEMVRREMISGCRTGQENNNAEARVRQYLQQLEHNFHYPQTIDEVAIQLRLSRRRFTQIFRKLTGKSWLDYLNFLRVAYACKLLKTTRRSILSIGFECGYEDISTFYRNFRRWRGISPSNYRKEGNFAA